MGKPSKDDVLVATETFTCEVDGETYMVHKDRTRVRADHPLAKANEDRFKPVDLSTHYDIEQATAAPGEKRGQQQQAAETEHQQKEQAAAQEATVSHDQPFDGYEDLNVKQVLEHLKTASPEDVVAIKAFEAAHQNRKTVLEFEPPKPDES